MKLLRAKLDNFARNHIGLTIALGFTMTVARVIIKVLTPKEVKVPFVRESRSDFWRYQTKVKRFRG